MPENNLGGLIIMKNKISKVVGAYVLAVAVCTSSLVVFASAMHYRNEGEKPAPTYPLNVNNETYGSSADAISEDTEPDLVLVQLADGALGYVRNEDLTGEVPSNPEEAVAMQIEKENRIQGDRGLKMGRTINAYDVNGEIVLGEFIISDGLPRSIRSECNDNN